MLKTIKKSTVFFEGKKHYTKINTWITRKTFVQQKQQFLILFKYLIQKINHFAIVNG